MATGSQTAGDAGAGSVVEEQIAGVWASDDSEFFESGMVNTGIAVYLRRDGLGAIAFGFPSIGAQIRVAEVVDKEPMHCVMIGGEAIRSCISRLRIRDGKLEVSDGESMQWERLRKLSGSISNSMREQFGWNAFDRHRSGDPVNEALQNARQLMALPDFLETHRLLKSVHAMEAFQTVYWGYSSNKAFAVTSDGTYGYSASGLEPTEIAIGSAKKYCEAWRRKIGATGRCEVANVNGEWVK